MERERIRLQLVGDVGMGLADVAAGMVNDASSPLPAIKRHRAVNAQNRTASQA